MESQLETKIVHLTPMHLFANVMKDGMVNLAIDPGLFPICF